MASAAIYGVTATFELVLPAHLSTSQVSWLFNPWLGAYTYTFDSSSLLGAVVLLGNTVVFVVAVAFYLNHCVADQPWWAILGGWAPMVSGFTLSQMQSAFGAWWVNIDVNHSGFPLVGCEGLVGIVVVGASWIRAPGHFSPTVSRPWAIAIACGICMLAFAQSAVGGSHVAWAVAMTLLFAVGLIVGSRAQWHAERPPATNALVAAPTARQPSGVDPSP